MAFARDEEMFVEMAGTREIAAAVLADEEWLPFDRCGIGREVPGLDIVLTECYLWDVAEASDLAMRFLEERVGRRFSWGRGLWRRSAVLQIGLGKPFIASAILVAEMEICSAVFLPKSNNFCHKGVP
jgi:hypothetical protein